MATWQEIGTDNFRAAVALYDGGYYRNATSRFYYAAFSALTYELILRGARAAFRDGRATPGHTEMPRLIRAYFIHMSAGRLANLTALAEGLYLDRLAADYSLIRVDRQSCRDSYLATEKIFNYLEVAV
ncbi:MAG: HEPN domain-containing protein [Janthinobacterium lividum]